MKITLRKANAVQLSINEMIKGLSFDSSVQLNEFEPATTQIDAVRFAVFAPNAQSVSVVGSFNLWNDVCHPMQKTDRGYWVLVIPQAKVGDKYKYAIKDAQGHLLPHKADPVGFSADQFPSHASNIIDHNGFPIVPKNGHGSYEL